MDYEQIIMQLIVNSGEARSEAMKGIRYGRNGEIEKANECLKTSRDLLKKAHEFHTNLLKKEAEGEKLNISLLIIHSQDHLMNAITVCDMAEEFINIYSNTN